MEKTGNREAFDNNRRWFLNDADVNVLQPVAWFITVIKLCNSVILA